MKISDMSVERQAVERERQWLRGILTDQELVEEVGICAAVRIMAKAP